MTGRWTTDAALAVLLGGAFGVGVCLVLVCLPRWGAPSLSRRIAPYIRDVSDPLGLTALTPLHSFGIRDLRLRTAERAASLLGGSAVIERRLRQSRRSGDVIAFRGRQLIWMLSGLGAGAALAVLAVIGGRGGGIAAVLPLVAAALAVVVCDAELTAAARRRCARIEDELPTMLDFLAMCLSAGEGILDSLRRVARLGSGELTAELRDVVLAVGTGAGLGDALTRMSADLQLPALSRSIDHIVAAIDRGAPLAQVLQAQAADAREEAKRGLIERAGRKEIYMLIPLVFLILPLSVLFAIFPGVFLLRLGIG
ncbi:type II secretion protein F [Microbacterium mangrovi]|uniref:Type II secretion protein F n=1 Tax=Microbacterium mangrovi TaxID=1348253 RepID=A0A0B2A6M5_9MICO|nr:type II secretion system F family protein [Microbacterium mangrovi]KHK97398.1 type II secretion protein F [Microbacterium mangrovi]